MSRETGSNSQNLALGAVVTIAGGAAVIYALLHRWNPQDIAPAVEGAMATTVLAPAVALLGGQRYLPMLLLMLPLWVAQYLLAVWVNAPAPAIVGIEMIVFGFFGFLTTIRLDELFRSTEEVRAPATPKAKLPKAHRTDLSADKG